MFADSDLQGTSWHSDLICQWHQFQFSPGLCRLCWELEGDSFDSFYSFHTGADPEALQHLRPKALQLLKGLQRAAREHPVRRGPKMSSDLGRHRQIDKLSDKLVVDPKVGQVGSSEVVVVRNDSWWLFQILSCPFSWTAVSSKVDFPPRLPWRKSTCQANWFGSNLTGLLPPSQKPPKEEDVPFPPFFLCIWRNGYSRGLKVPPRRRFQLWKIRRSFGIWSSLQDLLENPALLSRVSTSKACLGEWIKTSWSLLSFDTMLAIIFKP